MKKKIIVFGFGLIVLLLFLSWSRKSKAALKTETIKKGEVTEELILSGEVVAGSQAKLVFETSGTISYVAVKEGDKVAKGQLLTKLETTTFNSDYQRALSDLRDAQATVDKIHDDVKDHSSNETYAQRATRTTAEVAKDKAYEAVIKAEKALKGASLFAPFSGVVTYLANPFPGAFVLYTQTQVEIVDPNSVYFEVSADQTEVGSLKEKGEGVLVLDAFEDKEIPGVIATIAYTPKEGETGAVYAVRVNFKDLEFAKNSLKIGMTGDAKFTLAKKENVFYLPPQFVKADKKGSYLKTGRKNSKVYIETGLEGDDRIEIMGNLKEGQTVYD
jgi:macrolide-specific efflux system membrane fusion protein